PCPTPFRATGGGVAPARRPGDADLYVGARGEHPGRRIAERRPESLHFLRAAPRKEAEHGPRGVESETAPGIRPRGRRHPVFERMSHERRRDAALAKERFFER